MAVGGYAWMFILSHSDPTHPHQSPSNCHILTFILPPLILIDLGSGFHQWQDFRWGPWKERERERFIHCRDPKDRMLAAEVQLAIWYKTAQFTSTSALLFLHSAPATLQPLLPVHALCLTPRPISSDSICFIHTPVHSPCPSSPSLSSVPLPLGFH